jgi:hypothetical protein
MSPSLQKTKKKTEKRMASNKAIMTGKYDMKMLSRLGKVLVLSNVSVFVYCVVCSFFYSSYFDWYLFLSKLTRFLFCFV